MVPFPSFLLNRQSADCILFTVPGCSKCEKVKKILYEYEIQFQTTNIFENRSLLKDVPIEIKKQGFPLLKIHNTYYTYIDIKEFNR